MTEPVLDYIRRLHKQASRRRHRVIPNTSSTDVGERAAQQSALRLKPAAVRTRVMVTSVPGSSSQCGVAARRLADQQRIATNATESIKVGTNRVSAAQR